AAGESSEPTVLRGAYGDRDPPARTGGCPRAQPPRARRTEDPTNPRVDVPRPTRPETDDAGRGTGRAQPSRARDHPHVGHAGRVRGRGERRPGGDEHPGDPDRSSSGALLRGEPGPPTASSRPVAPGRPARTLRSLARRRGGAGWQPAPHPPVP